MSNTIPDGGPAFPCIEVIEYGSGPREESHAGMSLRDYFAGRALAGIEASQGNNGHFVSTVDKVAVRCFELADAMLAARSKEPT